MRFRSQASLISQTTIINMVSSTIGAVNVANVVSIFCIPPSDKARNVQSESLFQGRCEYLQDGQNASNKKDEVFRNEGRGRLDEKTRRQSIGARVPGMYGWRLYGCATPNAARSQDLQGMQEVPRQRTCCG